MSHSTALYSVRVIQRHNHKVDRKRMRSSCMPAVCSTHLKKQLMNSAILTQRYARCSAARGAEVSGAGIRALGRIPLCWLISEHYWQSDQPAQLLYWLELAAEPPSKWWGGREELRSCWIQTSPSLATQPIWQGNISPRGGFLLAGKDSTKGRDTDKY